MGSNTLIQHCKQFQLFGTLWTLFKSAMPPSFTSWCKDNLNSMPLQWPINNMNICVKLTSKFSYIKIYKSKLVMVVMPQSLNYFIDL